MIDLSEVWGIVSLHCNPCAHGGSKRRGQDEQLLELRVWTVKFVLCMSSYFFELSCTFPGTFAISAFAGQWHDHIGILIGRFEDRSILRVDQLSGDRCAVVQGFEGIDEIARIKRDRDRFSVVGNR